MAEDESIEQRDGPVLNVSTDIIHFLIDKSREFHAKEAVSIPEVPTSPADDWALQVLADHIDDYSYREFVDTVNDLEPDQQVELVALTWLGRADFDVDEWQEALAEAAAAYNKRTAEYLLATPLLADYLEEALAQLGYEDEAS